jgi:outer membrane lipoprotein-sorting protein
MKTIFILLMSILPMLSFSQLPDHSDPEAKAIIEKADEKLKGTSNQAEITMTIIRPTWEREMTMKSWSKGDDLSLILVTQPARDKGTAFLKREKEIWNWQPSIDRTIKMPPSMMTQSWMGSDFTNDDLVKQSSIVTDYTHTLLGKETIEGRECYKIQLIPHEDAAVVWGKVISWISVDEFLQLKTEFYDEDDYLVNTMLGKNVKEIGGKILPTRMEVIPEEEEGHMTVIEYIDLEFDIDIKDSFFSIQQMKRVQ